jgi:hypothetical protein
MTRINLHLALIFTFLFTATMGFARDYIIYSIAQDIPMGTPNEQLRKNYYVNFGSTQGIERGTLLDVFRIISMNDPYETNKRYDYRIKIGELRVIHSDQAASIAVLNNLEHPEDSPFVVEVHNFMIGDKVNVKVKP